MVPKWAWWLAYPCREGGAQRLRAEKESEWPTSGPSGYMTTTILGFHNALERGTKSDVAHNWAWQRRNPCRVGGPNGVKRWTKSEVAHKSA